MFAHSLPSIEFENEYIISWLLYGGRQPPKHFDVWYTLQEYGNYIVRQEKVQNGLSNREQLILLNDARVFANELIPDSLDSWICAQAKERTPWIRKNCQRTGGHEESIYMQLKPSVREQNQQHNTIDSDVFIPETVNDDEGHSGIIPQEDQEHKMSIEHIKEQARSLLKENQELSSKCYHLRNQIKRMEQNSFEDREENVTLRQRSESLKCILDAHEDELCSEHESRHRDLADY